MITKVDASVESDDPQKQLEVRIELARAQVEAFERARVASWELSPGNMNPGHVLMNAQNFHRVHSAWREANEKLCVLEASRVR